MFERYTEKARRAIFFARYEAAQLGSREVEATHLLWGPCAKPGTSCSNWWAASMNDSLLN